MKKITKRLSRHLIIILCLCMIFGLSACSKNEDDQENTKNPENTVTKTEESDTKQDEKTEDTPTPMPTEEPVRELTFDDIAENFDNMVIKAVSQYENEDYTKLAEPVKYNILWLGYTNVTYGELNFMMTDFDKAYLQAVALNFEKTVERITENNVDISIDLQFITEERELTKVSYDEWLFLAKETIQEDIDKFDDGSKYDSVISTIETSGDENVERNTGKEGYGVNYAILGVMLNGIEDGLGYSTFDLGKPVDGTYPLADASIPSLYATAVAVHEWMHQFEYLGKYLGIEYPPTHAYFGEEEYPGYQKYTAGQNNYDYFEFYELVLSGKLPYNDGSRIKHVGMYPEMWPLVKRGVALEYLGLYEIKNLNGEYLYANGEDKSLTISDKESLWNIYYGGSDRFILISNSYPDLRIDLSNAWDIENNTVGIYVYTGYDDAQSWKLKKNTDGTYCIRTPYSSGRAIAVDSKGSNAYISTTENGTSDVQKWVITKVEEN